MLKIPRDVLEVGHPRQLQCGAFIPPKTTGMSGPGNQEDKDSH
jgi:hypothetical protein